MTAQNLDELQQMCSLPYDHATAAMWCEAANDAFQIARDATVALELVRRIALYGTGPGTTPEEALKTIAEFLDRRIEAASRPGGRATNGAA